MFHTKFISELIDLGYEDAESKHHELETFFTPEKFVRTTFDLNPDVKLVEVLTQRTYLDRKTGGLKNGPVQRFAFDRKQFGSPPPPGR